MARDLRVEQLPAGAPGAADFTSAGTSSGSEAAGVPGRRL